MRVRIMKCKNCNVNDGIKYSKYASGDFCSRECAKSYSTKEKRLDINKHLSIKNSGIKFRSSVNKNSGFQKGHNVWKEYNIDRDEFKKSVSSGMKKYHLEKIINTPFELLTKESRKQLLIHERGVKCEVCHLTEWMNYIIPLDVDHIDGNHNNNVKENLRLLCPNCHRLTPTWGFKNRKHSKKYGCVTRWQSQES